MSRKKRIITNAHQDFIRWMNSNGDNTRKTRIKNEIDEISKRRNKPQYNID